MISAFFFALGVWVGWKLKGTRLAAWISTQLAKISD